MINALQKYNYSSELSPLSSKYSYSCKYLEDNGQDLFRSTWKMMEMSCIPSPAWPNIAYDEIDQCVRWANQPQQIVVSI